LAQRNRFGFSKKKIEFGLWDFSKFEFWPVEYFGTQEWVLDLGSVAKCKRGVEYPFMAVGVERTQNFGVPSV